MQHYEEVADRYERAWFYENGTPYQSWLLGHALASLDLRPTDAFVDVGCGTGNFTAALAIAAGLTSPALGVDPCAALVNTAPAPTVEPVVGDLTSLLDRPGLRVDKLLLKEVAHHIPLPELVSALSTLVSGGPIIETVSGFAKPSAMPVGGRVLIITRPKVSTHYPFFPQAHGIWSDHQPDEAAFVTALKTSGLTVTTTVHDFPVCLPKAQWLSMVANRFWSTFSHCTDDELAAGVKYIDEHFPPAPDGTLSFPDKLIFIIGEKK